MTFRRRIVLLSAAAVAAAIALGAVLTYVLVRHELRANVDAQLQQTRPQLAPIPGDGGPGDVRVLVRQDEFGGTTGVAQATFDDGKTIASADLSAMLPVDDAVREVAAGRRGAFLRDVTVAGRHLRVLTRPGPAGFALQVARPLDEIDSTLGRLRWILAAVTLAGFGLAAALGLGVSRIATRPLARLTATAERVTATGDLHHRIPTGGGAPTDDEPGRLAASFNAMLAALEASRDQQRQLVADASHELRTPLTAIRANIELLERAPELPDPERGAVLHSARGQLEDLTVLVGDLVDLARPGGERALEPPEDLRLDELVAAAVERARRHAPGTPFEVTGEPCVVRGRRPGLARAVGNLLDNAVKWSPPDAPVEVDVRDGVVTVRDHGPGIAPQDLPHVFDRFYRAPSARGLPGSGLGLAIVKHVADDHRGSVVAEHAPGGGTLLRLALPT
jgi:two-component system sensor histidine kinase MprB